MKITKTIDTKSNYYKRAISLIKKSYKDSTNLKNSKFKKTSSYKDIDGKTFIGLDLYSTAAFFKIYWSGLSSSTIRAYRSSLIFFAEIELKSNRIEKEEFRRFVVLLKSIKTTKDKSVKLTSANKQKHLSPKDLKFLDISLRDSKSKWGKPLRVWLRAGVLTGLRPIEWRTSKYDETTNSLIVRNAKNTNGRANGDIRTLSLNHLDNEDVGIIKQQVILANKFEAGGLWQEYYNGCSNLIRYTSRKIWPSRKRRPTLYSTRHQYCANLKASGMRTNEVASLMGHASDETAAETYGRKISGTKGRKPEVNKLELVGVREKFSSKFLTNLSKPNDGKNSIK